MTTQANDHKALPYLAADAAHVLPGRAIKVSGKLLRDVFTTQREAEEWFASLGCEVGLLELPLVPVRRMAAR